LRCSLWNVTLALVLLNQAVENFPSHPAIPVTGGPMTQGRYTAVTGAT
jgi:hypothetical protein